jgi:hypothetical protein
MARSIAAGSVYFAVVFVLGFFLGAFRVLITAPKLGTTAAALVELPLILTASWFAAKWCVSKFHVSSELADRLAVGSVAFCLTMLAELSLSMLLFGRTVPAHFGTYAHWLGLAGLFAQILFALFPLLQRRAGRQMM